MCKWAQLYRCTKLRGVGAGRGGFGSGRDMFDRHELRSTPGGGSEGVGGGGGGLGIICWVCRHAFNKNNNQNAFQLMMKDECRTSLVSPKQSVLSVFVWPSNAAFMTITWCIVIVTKPRAS